MPADLLPGGTFATKDELGEQLMVNKITWRRAGGVTEPGRYMFTFGWLTVTEQDLAIWQRFPEASFTLVELPASPCESGEPGEVQNEEFHLGTFEVPITSH